MNAQPVGLLLRNWRERRRLSQLELAALAEISSRHLSFVETGRSLPSRAMLLRLADRLEIPLRQRNLLFTAAGMAPLYSERTLDDPQAGDVRRAIELVLRGHEPYPALAVDRHWTLVAANRAVAPLLAGVAPHLLAPPVDVLRLSLDPEGIASRIVNFDEWREHVLERLRHQAATTGDPVLEAMCETLAALPMPPGAEPVRAPTFERPPAMVVPLKVRTALGELSFVSTTTVFATPRDVTLAELAIESFFPADAATQDALRRLPLGA